MREIPQRTRKCTNQEKKLAHIFLSISKCKNTTKRLKKHQETRGNFSGIFVRELTRTGVQVARKIGAISKDSQETGKEPKA